MKKLVNSITELELILAGLNGENSCIVIGKNGAIYTGNIPVEKLGKLREIPVKIHGKTSSNLDGNGTQEYISTNSWVSAPGRMFKNSWDNSMLKLPENSVNSSMIMMWVLLVELSDIEDIKCGKKIITGNNYSYFSVSIGDVTAYYNNNFMLRFITVEGDKDIDGKLTEYSV
jgi:hypothetical protein